MVRKNQKVLREEEALGIVKICQHLSPGKLKELRISSIIIIDMQKNVIFNIYTPCYDICTFLTGFDAKEFIRALCRDELAKFIANLNIYDFKEIGISPHEDKAKPAWRTIESIKAYSNFLQSYL